ncbi:septum formation family protein [Nocardioides sp. ChNu-153]|uniref:septum formation family protein n=1 Tax=Nocardioides sp. ChNu-153 TaxID=2779364 RepID=UPI0026520D6A|nr:septum formation family protein [Nocardioides sp. ChNu-153]MDN7120750.1 septum formation family protein [Nocardioides sp. ChNu-153]
MSVRAAARRTTVLAAAAVLALAGCSGGDEGDGSGTPPAPSSSTTTAAAPPTAAGVPRPPLDACYALSAEEAVAPTSAADPVDCAASPTAVTYEVGALDLYDAGHLLAVDSAQVQRTLATTCRAGLASYLGTDETTLRLSVLRSVWFSPSLEQSDAGADWYRCDVIAVVAEATLGELEPTMRGVLADGVRSWGLCGTARPGEAGFQRVACGLDHTWRAVEVVDLGTGAYPGAEAAQGAGSEPCQEAARELAADALDYEWGYEWPSAEQWAAGQTWGTCWAPA